MDKIIDMLPAGKLHTQTVPPAPLALRRFDRPVNGLQMIYPVDGSLLHYKAGGLRVPLEIKDASYPLWVSLNGLSLQQLQSRHASLSVPQKGGYKLTIVDSQHRAAAVYFHVD